MSFQNVISTKLLLNYFVFFFNQGPQILQFILAAPISSDGDHPVPADGQMIFKCLNFLPPILYILFLSSLSCFGLLPSFHFLFYYLVQKLPLYCYYLGVFVCFLFFFVDF
jgi:hypothetical protein